MTVSTCTHRIALALTLVLLATLIACQSASVSNDSKPETFATPPTANELWAVAVTNGEDLSSFYANEAIRINPDGSYLEGAAAIAEYWSDEGQAIDTTFVIASEAAGQEAAFAYEIVATQSKDGALHRHLVIWNQQEEARTRVLEFSARLQKESLPAASTLDAFRAQWISRCNAHNAYELVANSYTPNALYYNHKPLVIGTEAIAKEYAYMNNPKYQLQLSPLAVEMISESLALEIGQCSGSYGGKYVLIWQKNEAGVWQVLFDSNI